MHIWSFVLGVAAASGVLAAAAKLYFLVMNFLQQQQQTPPSPLRSVASPTTSASAVVIYRTRNGRADYEFEIFRCHDGEHRIYIRDHPSYGSRDSDGHATHRFHDERGDYVCWTGELDSIEKALKIAALWADKTEDYILYGSPF